jgi:outer membrane protein assembly factor BamB
MQQLRTGLPILIVLCGVVGSVQQAGSSTWPRFRGPNGTGIASDTDVPVQWSEKEGVQWKTRIPGAGNSSPIVWGDKVFLQSATADGRERLLLCLDAANGKVLWSRSLPGSKARTHAKNSLASSTCATDGQRVYTLFWDGTRISADAFDFQGKQLWSRDLGRFVSQHGAGTSPIVFQDKVILANDQDGAATVYALDARDGTIVWKTPRPAFRACYSAPFLLERPGRPAEVIVASTAGITSYNPQNGSENWKYSWSFTGMALRTVASPIFADGLVIANSGDGSGARHLIAVKVGDRGDVTSTNLAWEWKKNRPFPYVPTMLAWGEHLYFVSDRGDAGCVVAKTGEPVWTQHLCQGATASPILIDGKVYAISDDGIVYVFQASPTFKLLAKNALGEAVSATPAVADNRLFIRTSTHLLCIGKPAEKRAARE